MVLQPSLCIYTHSIFSTRITISVYLFYYYFVHRHTSNLANVEGNKYDIIYNVGNTGTRNPSIRNVITFLILQNETAGANY
jgi:hypothetical protein